jgi:DNA modification methylase
LPYDYKPRRPQVCREGDLVFDPFCGSGSSGVAAKELGRFFVGAEKEEEYAELAARRIEAAVRGKVLREIPHLSARRPGRTAFTW